MRCEITEFLAIHKNVSPILKWETLKAYLRGSVIKFSGGKPRPNNRSIVLSVRAIKLKTGKISVNRDEINDEFKQYYTDFYNLSTESPNLNCNFWSDLTILPLNKCKLLNKPLHETEIVKAVSELRQKKSPGPDGFPIEFYMSFIEILTPLLKIVYDRCLEKKILPETLNQSQIVLLLKSNKDPLEPSSYRPVFLLNCDYKILAKILAFRLGKILPIIVAPDQTGYIKNRRSIFNVNRLLEIMYSFEPNDSQCLILTDAEKAFDSLKIAYLLKTLRKFNLGEPFVSWIESLYSNPTACVWTGDRLSDFFPLKKGIRQGCPLSPLLFVAALEPLACFIRQNSAIKGIVRARKEYKISLYADDVLIFVSQVEETVPLVLKIFEEFKTVSGYSLNLDKSKIVPLGLTKFKKSVSLTVSTDDFIYLGVTITKSKKDLLSRNLKALRLKKDLNPNYILYVLQSIIPFI